MLVQPPSGNIVIFSGSPLSNSNQSVPNRPSMCATIAAWMFHDCYDDDPSLGSPTADRGATRNEQQGHPLHPGTPC